MCGSFLYSSIQSLKYFFLVAKSIPTTVYVVLFLTFCAMYSFCAFSLIIVIYVHKEFGISDIEAGTIYGMFGAFMALWGMLSSLLNDCMGVRSSLLFSFALSTFSSTILAITRSRYVFIFVYNVLFSLGSILGQPMLSVAIHRLSDEKTRSFYFGLSYAATNFAALISGPIVDALNIDWKPHPYSPFIVFKLSGSRLLILTCSVASFSGLIASFLLLKESRSTWSLPSSSSISEYVLSSEKIPLSPPPSWQFEFPSDAENYEVVPAPGLKSFLKETLSILNQKSFYRFIIFNTFLLGLNYIYVQFDATFPTYLTRVFGDTVPKGTIFSLNPLIIVILSPLMSIYTRKYSNYNMIRLGALLSSLSLLFISISTSLWAAVCMVVLFSVGESLWAPRVQDYAMGVAPQARPTLPSPSPLLLFSSRRSLSYSGIRLTAPTICLCLVS